MFYAKPQTKWEKREINKEVSSQSMWIFLFLQRNVIAEAYCNFFSHLELKGSFLVSPENPGCGVITWFCSLFSTNRNQTWLDLGSFYPGSMRIFHGSEKTLESWIRRLKCRQCQALAVFSWYLAELTLELCLLIPSLGHFLSYSFPLVCVLTTTFNVW